MLTLREMGKPQGVPRQAVDAALHAVDGSARAVAQANGDAMPTNALMRVRPRALHCAGLLAAQPPDVWQDAAESGKALGTGGLLVN